MPTIKRDELVASITRYALGEGNAQQMRDAIDDIYIERDDLQTKVKELEGFNLELMELKSSLEFTNNALYERVKALESQLSEYAVDVVVVSKDETQSIDAENPNQARINFHA